jgi:hypothetical protein
VTDYGSDVVGPPLATITPTRIASLCTSSPWGLVHLNRGRRGRPICPRTPTTDVRRRPATPHTDTPGRTAVNHSFATRRGAAFRGLPVEARGIAASSVFVAELPTLIYRVSRRHRSTARRIASSSFWLCSSRRVGSSAQPGFECRCFGNVARTARGARLSERPAEAAGGSRICYFFSATSRRPHMRGPPGTSAMSSPFTPFPVHPASWSLEREAARR